MYLYSDKYVVEKLFPKYFVGENPPGIIFGTSLDGLCDMVKQSKNITVYKGVVESAALISLVAYFEVFCKDYFAAILNVCPNLLNYLLLQERQNEYESLKKINYIDTIETGTQVSEELKDFGRPKKVNTLYNDLLKFRPFSSDKILIFRELLLIRNVIVHYGNIVPSKYADDSIYKFKDYVVINEEIFFKYAHFLENMVIKILELGNENLLKLIIDYKIELNEERKAILPFSDCYNQIL